MKRSVVVVLVYLLISTMLTGVFYLFVRDWELEKNHNLAGDKLLSAISVVRSKIKKFDALPFLLSKQIDVGELLKQPNLKNLYRVRRYLEQTNLIAGSAALIILDHNGEVAAYSNWREAPENFSSFYVDSPFFKQAVNGEQGSGVWLADKQAPWFYFSAPIYQNKAFVGAAVVRLDVARLLSDLSIDGDFFITDRKDQLIFSNNQRLTTQALRQKQSFRYLESSDDLSVRIFQTQRGKSFLWRQVMLDDTQWRIGVLTALTALEKARWSTLALFTVFLIIGLIGMYLREYRSKKRSQDLVISARIESEARGRYIINTAQSGLITLDSHGRITFINPLVMRYFGLSLTLVLHQPIATLFVQLEKFLPLKRVLDNIPLQKFSSLSSFEAIAKRSDGSTFPVLFSIKKMRDQPEAEYLVTLVDITQRKRLEQRLKEMNESLESKVLLRTKALEEAQGELVRSEKLAALGRMSTAIVHDLNQPLTAIRTYLAIIEKVGDNPSAIAEYLGSLNQLVDNMAAITSQLKMFAYSKPNGGQCIDLTSCIERTITGIKPLLDKNAIDLQFKPLLDGQKVLIEADEMRITQMMTNLIHNTLDAFSDSDREQFKRLSVQLVTEESCIIIVVNDNAGGADAEQLPFLFDPFYTTKDIGLGLGLGLSIVKSIVVDLGGTISVENKDAGLCFCIKFTRIESESLLAE